ncbi:MAG: hypothetical protein Q7R97_00420 [Candidatus Daviesbacteria bacterium]|nr:hypothetical protein [Candidatus Daviesbacteria bacterium]
MFDDTEFSGWGLKSKTSESTNLTPIQRLEKEVLEGAPSTPRNISMYSKSLGFPSTEEFIKHIKGKKIADVGSGFTGFALDVALQGLDAMIIPINPVGANSSFTHDRRETIKLWRDLYYPEFNMLTIDASLRKIDKQAITAFAHDLSAIPNDAVDEVIDNLAVFHYSKPEYRELYEQSIKEMLRILKPDGIILIGDASNLKSGREPWYKEIFDKLDLDYHYLERDISLGNIHVNQRYGFEIIKH